MEALNLILKINIYFTSDYEIFCDYLGHHKEQEVEVEQCK